MPGERLLTWRALLFGAVGVLFVAGLAGFHDDRIWGSTLMVGSHLPVGALSYIMVVGLLWNGVAGRVNRKLVLSSRELAVVLIVTLVSCCVPTSGLFRYFQRAVMLPWYYLTAGGKADWIQFKVLDYLPHGLFPSPFPVVDNKFVASPEVDTVYRGFYTGLSQGNRTVGLSDLPLANWLPCMLMYWLPLIVAVSVCMMALSLLVHRQWARHEQLSYPLAQVAGSFTECGDGRVPTIFRNRLFWWGFALVFCFYSVEYLSRWYPESVPGMSKVLPAIKGWWVPVTAKIPIVAKTPGAWALCGQSLFFSIFGLSFFCSTEVSLTMGLSNILLTVVGVWFYTSTGKPLAENDMSVFRAGAYLGYTLILLYTGRVYFWRITQQAFWRWREGDREDPSVMAARLFVAAFAGTVLVFVWMGQDWVIALFYTTLLTAMFLVFTRVVCETGIPFFQTGWFPAHVLIALMGPAAVGPGPVVFFSWISAVLCQDPRECLMPYVATSLRVADGRLRLRRLFGTMTVALLAALAIGFLATTWNFYDAGAMKDGHASATPPREHFDSAARQLADLNESGLFDASAAAHGLSKLGLLAPDHRKTGYLVTGGLLVIAFSLLRFRFSRFPLHPVLFLVCGTYAGYRIWSSFLLGWAVKTIVVKFGGNQIYQRVKPLFIGVIAGELGAAGVVILIDLLYYLIMGRVPSITFQVLAS